MSAIRAISALQPIAVAAIVPAPKSADRTRPLARPLALPAPSAAARLVAPQLQSRLPPARIVARSFDWDDNVMFMPTDVVLFHKTTGEEKRIDTGRWAGIRSQVGVAGAWAEWEMRGDDRDGSFRDAHDLRDASVFVRDVTRALEGPTGAWQGPRWAAFQEALSTEEGARRTTIITARGHEPTSVRAALALLQSRGLLAHLPPLENIFPVDNPTLRAELQGKPGQPTPSKLKVMARLLDELHAQPFGLHADRVIKPSGDGRAVLHLWHFSDDDPKTYRTALAELGARIAEGRWSNVKIVLTYTGKPNDGLTPESMVLRRDGSARPLRPEEQGEL